MKIQKTSIYTETFHLVSQMMLDIQIDEISGVAEAYIYAKDYGIKKHLIGLALGQADVVYHITDNREWFIDQVGLYLSEYAPEIYDEVIDEFNSEC